MQSSDARLIDIYVTNKTHVSLKQLRLSCGLPRRVTDRMIRRYLNDYHPGVIVGP